MCQGEVPDVSNFAPGQRVKVWSGSARRWFDDGEVQAVHADGSVSVRFNNFHPSSKEVAAKQTDKVLRKLSGSVPKDLRAFLRQSIGCGRFPMEAQKKVREAFTRLDADGDGALSREDLLLSLKTIGWTSDDGVGSILAAADTNLDGVIDYDEFVAWLYVASARPQATGHLPSPPSKNHVDSDGNQWELVQAEELLQQHEQLLLPMQREELPEEKRKRIELPMKLRMNPNDVVDDEQHIDMPMKGCTRGLNSSELPASGQQQLLQQQLKLFEVTPLQKPQLLHQPKFLEVLPLKKYMPPLQQLCIKQEIQQPCIKQELQQEGDGAGLQEGRPYAGFFSGCVVLICPKGGTYMSAARRHVLQTRICDAGGFIAEFWDEHVTHVVVVPRLPASTLEDAYRDAKRGADFKGIVIDSWLCDSLATGHCLPVGRYIWKPPLANEVKEEEPRTLRTPSRKACKRKASSSQSPNRTHKRKRHGFPEREGDWYCAKCGQHNFKSREICWRRDCGQAKPESPAMEINTENEMSATAQAKDQSDASPDAFREKLVEEFRICAAAWAVRGDKWRSWQYKKAEQLVSHASSCSLGTEEIKHLGLTPKFVQKCDDIRRNGFLEQADVFRKDADIQVLLVLTRIHGVGPGLAQTWLRLGVRSLDDVRARADTLPGSAGGACTGLTKAQRLGLRFVDDFEVQIPRAEVERLAAQVQKHGEKAGLSAKIVPCGGYRAGDAFCNGATFIVSFDGSGSVETEAAEYLEALDACGIVVADLSSGGAQRAPTPVSVPGDDDPTGAAQACLCVAKGEPAEGEPMRYRRCDFVFCRHSALPFVMLQWTGSDHGLFNRELKRIAALRGLHLSHTYICKADREGARGRQVGEVCLAGAKIECADEEAVFAALGLPYRLPEHRKVDDELLSAVEQAAREAPDVQRRVKAEIQSERMATGSRLASCAATSES
eukprot:TRINITY_DN24217_c0_g2_i1.p1 TRINITY_DN24217_c0_g2~~TRINITY_DN24217_c0_g2_i1.p1  ORF type:complete len:975 (-),score=198.26 TRINITY_DN24217_c0_g2_i1:441-3278(-)